MPHVADWLAVFLPRLNNSAWVFRLLATARNCPVISLIYLPRIVPHD